MEISQIVIGCDHGGFELKNQIIAHLQEKGIKVLDVGTYNTSSCAYPLYAHAVCEKIQREECSLGILVCGTGIGMSMTANKHKGIRAAVCGDTFSARQTRQHNNANVLCLGARVTGCGLALDIVDTFLQYDFEGGRHQERIDMMASYENEQHA